MPPPFHGTLNVPFIFVPLKALSDQVWIGYPCFCCWKFILICGFVEKVTRISCLKEWLEKLKTTLASIFFIWLWFQVYRCKSSIAWRVTRNCAYIPFNNFFILFLFILLDHSTGPRWRDTRRKRNQRESFYSGSLSGN